MKRIPRSDETAASIFARAFSVSRANREPETSLAAWAHPVLSAAQTAEFEERLFEGDENREWAAMQDAGRAVAEAVWHDFARLGCREKQPLRLLVLAGKGHNGGDALIAAESILTAQPTARADVFLVYGVRALRPLAWRAWAALQNHFPDRVRAISARELSARVDAQAHYELCLDGVFGLKFRPPMDARAAAALTAANALSVGLRAAVDLPSGLAAGADSRVIADPAGSADSPATQADLGSAESPVFRADFTYATGALKREVLGCCEAGRLRYLDLGFFRRESPLPLPSGEAPTDRVLTKAVLASLRKWRDPQTNKRREGHVFVLAGSREYPGAALMCVLAALRSGAGLVTGFVPESLVPSFAARVPEAIWVGCPETERGSLALEGREEREGQHLLRERIDRAAGARAAGGVSLVIGPGIGRERETQLLVSEIVKAYAPRLPTLLDADALQPELITGAKCSLVLTPHEGEFKRIAGTEATDAHLREFANRTGATVVLKGPVTRICDGIDFEDARPIIIHSLFGGPVLARGGSGDLLAGMIGAQLSKRPGEPRLQAISRAVAWHGLAAETLERTHGLESTLTTQLLDHLGVDTIGY